ncbi:MAG: hypothetical protein ACNI3H_15110 [Halarcobacter ebronensis]
MKKKWIIIRLEITTREFQSKSLLAYKLAMKGYGVIVKHDIADDVKIFPKGLYFINSIYQNSHRQIKKIYDHGNKIFCLDEEGLVIRSADEYVRRLPDSNLELLTKFFCTGDNQYELLRKGTSIDKNKLVISGNPRINMLDKGFNIIEEKKYLKSKKNMETLF